MRGATFSIGSLLTIAFLTGCGGNSSVIQPNALLSDNYIVVSGKSSSRTPAVILNVDTGRVVRELPFSGDDVAVSPDRKTILFNHNSVYNGGGNYVYDVSTGTSRKIVDTLVTNLAYGPGEGRISFSTAEYFGSMAFDGTDLQTYLSLVSDGTRQGAFSPNGQFIASIVPAAEYASRGIQLRSSRGQLISNIFEDGGRVCHLPSWAPDNRTIAFFHYRIEGLFSKQSLMIVDRVTGNSKRIVEFDAAGYALAVLDERSELKISWSPRGDALVFSALVQGTPYLFHVKADGSDFRPLGDINLSRRSVAWTN